MWSMSHSENAEGVSKESIWAIWTDVEKWHRFNNDVEYARLHGKFMPGTVFELKPRKGPKVNIKLVEVIHGQSFTDLTSFPLARMYGRHDIEDTLGSLTLTATISIEGPLRFLWRWLVAQGIADRLGDNLKNLIQMARELENEK